MREGDVDAIMAIENVTYIFPWAPGIFHDCLRIGYCCWVYEQAGMIQAYAVMSVGGGESHILNICVRPELRNRGLGRSLLDYMLDLARGHHADTVFLEVRPSNHAALKLYKDTGFNEVGVRKSYYPAINGKEDAVIMARSLSS
jgi:ribosomal-protein-alanine N-acetyltransferase